MSTPPARVYEHLTETSRHTSRPVREVALEWAHGVDGDWSWWVPAGDIVIAILNPHQDRAPLDDATVLAVELMTDPTWPAWVRAALAWRYAVTVRRVYASEPDDDPDRRAWLTGLLADWDEAEHMVWEEIAWPGPFADDATSQWGPYRLRWFELQERLAAQQVAWCRARLEDIPLARACDLAAAEAGRHDPFLRVALAHGGRPRLWARDIDADPRRGARAAELAADDSLSEGFRAAAKGLQC